MNNITVSSKVEPFTLEKYIRATKLPKERLYLATKTKEINVDEKARWYKKPLDDIPNVIDIDVSDDDEVSLPSFDWLESRMLKSEQDNAYETSLKLDRAKEEKKKEQLLKEISQVEEQEKLCQMRSERYHWNQRKAVIPLKSKYDIKP